MTFRFNFDSSGTLKTQIQEGADCDLFLSAGQKQMNQLDITASADVNTEGLDFVDSDSRVDLLENKVVLCVPENSDQGIDGFDSLAEHLKAAERGDRDRESRLVNRLGQLRRCVESSYIRDGLKEQIVAAVDWLRNNGRTVDFSATDPARWISQRGGAPRW